MKNRVLLLGSNDRAALAAARSLGRNNIAVDIARIGPPTICEKSRYVARTVDLGDARRQVKRSTDLLLDHLSKEGYDVLIPMGDAAAELASHARDDISNRTHLAMPNPQAYQVCHDKEQTLRFGRSLGVPVPAYCTLRHWEDMEGPLLVGVRFPCYLKPNYSAKVVGDTIAEFRVRKARTEAHLLDFCRFNLGNTPIMVQEECPGVGAGIYLLAREGRILSMTQQVRLHEPRDGGGGSYRMTTAIDPKLASYAHAIIAESHWDGVAMIEFKGDPSRGDWVLMEINGRFWGSLALTIRSGLDFPLWLYQLCIDPDLATEPIQLEPRIHVRQRHLKKDIGWFAKTLPRSPNKFRFLWSWMRGFRHLAAGNEGLDSESLSDPLPALWDWLAPGTAQWRRVMNLIRRIRWFVRYKSTENVLVEQVRGRLRSGKRNILFVCKGNICRSAFAEHYFVQQHGVASVRSAGTLMRSNRMAPAAVERMALQEFGVDMRNHRSQGLSQGLIEWADVIFVMDYRNLADLRRASRTQAPVVLLGSIGCGGQVSDPYNRSRSEIHAALKRIKRDVDRLAEVLGETVVSVPHTQTQVA